ncbi:hypothetical protein V8C34DRAFT_295957 [Trichoderma compactum]
MSNPPDQPTLLLPFGDVGKDDKNWFRVAFRFKRDDILGWMKKVASQNNPNCPSEDLRTKKHFDFLLEIYDQLESLATNGSKYNEPDVHKCHIYRKLNPGYGKKKTQSQDVSQFLVETWTNNYDSGPDIRNINLDYWCVYDLIGLFLGLLGSAPPAADRNNYFLPLTAVYARWCSRLAGKLKNKKSQEPEAAGIGPIPTMFQCTWRERKDGKGKWFFLGASVAGDQFANNASGSDWQLKVQMERFNMLLHNQQTTMVSDGEFNSTEPELEAGGSGNLWGNCAETYPFVQCMAKFDDAINSNQIVQGLALSKTFIDQKDPVLNYSGYADDIFWTCVRPPCGNCAELLKRVKANDQYFAEAFEIENATYRVPPAPPSDDVEVAEGFVIRDMKEPLIQEMVEVTSN